MTTRPALPLADRRNLGTIEHEAKEVLRQVEFLRRNGDGDQLRFLVLRSHAHRLLNAAVYGARRYERLRDWRRRG